MTTDSISDLIARINNAAIRKKAQVEVPNTNVSVSILGILKQENYITGYTATNKSILVDLKYVQGKSVIRHFERMSKPGLRVYYNYKKIPKVLSGLGIGIYSTSKGVLTSDKAKKELVGGEYLCRIW